MSDKPSKETIYVAHDIEKTGSFMASNPINSIGFFVADSRGNCLETFKMNIKVRAPTIDTDGHIASYGDYEPRCWNEFYSSLPKEIYEKTLHNPEETLTAWKKIASWIDNLEVKYPSSTHTIIFITDNASFDTASIDYNLERYAGRAPMRYSNKNEYRNVFCISGMTCLISKDKYKSLREEINKRVIHDHDPVHDAEFILNMYFMIRDLLQR